MMKGYGQDEKLLTSSCVMELVSASANCLFETLVERMRPVCVNESDLNFSAKTFRRLVN